MSEKIKVELGKVQETLLLPLWGRAIETQKTKPRLVDNMAVEIINKIDYNFSTIAKNINPITRFAWVARCLHTDNVIKNFLKTYPCATIVNIGCGLDTTFDRIDNGKIMFYDLDLPDVVSLRKNFFHETERRHMIASSFLDTAWFSELKVSDGIIFISLGVLYYFDESQVKNFFVSLADYFHTFEMMFDIASPLGVRTSNKKVLEGGGMDKSTVLKWGVENSSSIAAWDHRIKIINEFPMFKGMKKGFRIDLKFGLLMSDLLKIMSLVHLRIEK